MKHLTLSLIGTLMFFIIITYGKDVDYYTISSGLVFFIWFIISAVKLCRTLKD